MFIERLVLVAKAERFFKDITCSIDFGEDLDNEKGTQDFHLLFLVIKVIRFLCVH